MEKFAQGCVVPQKCDVDGKPIGTTNQNPILDTFLCEVEFPGCEITLSAANIIAASMFAPCNVDENEYILLEVFINH